MFVSKLSKAQAIAGDATGHAALPVASDAFPKRLLNFAPIWWARRLRARLGRLPISKESFRRIRHTGQISLAMITSAFIAASSMVAFAQTGAAGAGAAGTSGMSRGFSGYGANVTGTIGTTGRGSAGVGYGGSTGPVTGEPGLPDNINGAGLGSGAGGGGLVGGSGGPAQAGAGMSGQ